MNLLIKVNHYQNSKIRIYASQDWRLITNFQTRILAIIIMYKSKSFSIKTFITNNQYLIMLIKAILMASNWNKMYKFLNKISMNKMKKKNR